MLVSEIHVYGHRRHDGPRPSNEMCFSSRSLVFRFCKQLEMLEGSLRWVPKFSEVEMRKNRAESYHQTLAGNNFDEHFFYRHLVTVDKTSIYVLSPARALKSMALKYHDSLSRS